ncbi:arylsulfatase I-like [Littorina saxatilis]|uniref:Sulfatase N-terminal domain-containing protein n=1 Tax=Littorina saxatilis TaxID=31220 RepID=A0AAN9BGK7_9CAEN
MLNLSPLHVALLLLLALGTCLVSQTSGTSQQPNIVYILIDDAGWGDFQTHDPLMVSPNIARLRQEGMFLNQSYVLPMCGPTRSALLTGRYPHTFGMQDNTVGGNKKFWMNETFMILPQELQSLGYTTHMLGKWHLGYCHPGLTPLGRGFNTFYGFWLGSHNSYYDHTKGSGRRRRIYDWWDGDSIDWSARGQYQTDLLSARAVRIVEESSPSNPFFMYLSYGAVHGPFEVPQHYIDTYCAHVTNTSRQIHCAMMAALDEGVGNVVQALKRKGTYDNTIILVMSDNGGPIKGGSVNWPLRGEKKSVFEGGVRSYTVLKAPGLAETNVTWPGMVHAIDWLPTLLTAAGGVRPDYTHGKNLWQSMTRNEPSPRTDFIYNVNDFRRFNHIAVRLNKWKLLGPVPGLARNQKWTPGFKIGWYPPYQLLDRGVPWEDMKRKYSTSQYLLFNLEQDPEERNNVYNDPRNADIVRQMEMKIEYWVGQPGVLDGVYPLQPINTNPDRGRNNNGQHLATCWCDPPGFADRRNVCPAQGRNGRRRGRNRG